MVVIWGVCGPPKIREIWLLTSFVEHLDVSKSTKLKSGQYFCMENNFLLWSEIFHSFLKTFLLKIGPKFVRPTDTSYYNHFWKHFAHNPISCKQKSLSYIGQYLWHLQETCHGHCIGGCVEVVGLTKTHTWSSHDNFCK